jgi:CDP-paratose 2-epimerase
MRRFFFKEGRGQPAGQTQSGEDRNPLPEAEAGFPGEGSGRGAVVITGGAGFIGANLADRLLSSGQRVLIFDNLSRPGVESNLEWLNSRHGAMLSIEIGDIRNATSLHWALEGASAVFHFAAQVAVTNSLIAPRHDFEINVRGTINLLEALRRMQTPPPLILTSTNKVYGDLGQVALREERTRYSLAEPGLYEGGIDEDQQLEFHSPYGCSKGAADQYVLDYARSFGLPAVVFRMSCIYGPHQFGNEDQGWVAHFLRCALKGEPITIYGNGKQVRDALFVEDLLDAFLLVRTHIGRLAGNAFNIGGGPRNTLSLLELVELVREIHSLRPQLRWSNWRVGDQKFYVTDFSKFQRATGWSPRVSVRAGVERLSRWLQSAEAKALAPELF